MGIVRMGPPAELILILKHKYELSASIETGTYKGKTAIWAASHFDTVTTIENCRPIYDQTIAQYGNMPNINFVFGDSRSVLKAVIPNLNETTVFWLDSHWCGGHTNGEDDQCSLVDELAEISKSPITHFLFIDDARLFTSPPPLPNRIECWPGIDKVIGALQLRTEKYYIVIFEDVIIGVPHYAEETIASYCQKANTKAWKERGERIRRQNEPSVLLRQGAKLIKRGTYVYLKRLLKR